jgi:hypothetical protein
MRQVSLGERFRAQTGNLPHLQDIGAREQTEGDDKAAIFLTDQPESLEVARRDFTAGELGFEPSAVARRLRLIFCYKFLTPGSFTALLTFATLTIWM